VLFAVPFFESYLLKENFLNSVPNYNFSVGVNKRMIFTKVIGGMCDLKELEVIETALVVFKSA
jgi:hypothetical protein